MRVLVLNCFWGMLILNSFVIGCFLPLIEKSKIELVFIAISIQKGVVTVKRVKLWSVIDYWGNRKFCTLGSNLSSMCFLRWIDNIGLLTEENITTVSQILYYFWPCTSVFNSKGQILCGFNTIILLCRSHHLFWFQSSMCGLPRLNDICKNFQSVHSIEALILHLQTLVMSIVLDGLWDREVQDWLILQAVRIAWHVPLLAAQLTP